MTPNRTYSPILPVRTSRLRGRRWLRGLATANYSLLTANWTFTFSAKEKDSETGLSYFGSRYYSSDLSIWLSVDPMSDKYAYQSGYVYCGNNPIKVIDPNGEDESPIFTTEGKLKGVDNQGWCGMPIVMKEEDYHDNMSHEEALKVGRRLDEYGEGISISDETWKEVAKHTGCRMYPYVINNSDETIYYKPEGTDHVTGYNYNPGYDETEAYEIGPHKDLYTRIDGIKTSKIPDGKVYKVPTNFRVVVNGRGIPDIKGLPFEIYFEYKKMAGTIDTPDAGWEKLAKSKPGIRK